MRAFITSVPWGDYYEVRLAYQAGRITAAATGIEDGGYVIFEEIKDSDETKPFLKLRPDQLEALARAFGEVTQANDQTLESLKDARGTRDRLLTLIERRGVA